MKVEGLLLLVAYLSAERQARPFAKPVAVISHVEVYDVLWEKWVDIPNGVSPVRPIYRVCGCSYGSSRRGNGSFKVGLIISPSCYEGHVGDVPLLK